jgi:translocation and assembly module TamB
MILKTIRYSFLALIILILVALAAMQIREVKLYAFSKLSQVFKESTGYSVSVNDLELMLPFEVKATDLLIESDNGNSLEAKRAVIRLNPSSLLEKKLQFHSINLDDVVVTEIAPVEAISKPSQQELSIDFDQLPIYLSIPQFHAQNVIIHSTKFPEVNETPIDIEAHFTMDPENKTISAGFKIIDHEITEKFISADGEITEEGGNLLVDLAVHENKSGFINLPENVSLDGKAHLIGTVETWNQFLNQQMTPDRILGDLRIEYALGEKETGDFTGNIFLSSQKGLEISNIEGQATDAVIKGDLFYQPSGRFDGTEFTISIPDIAAYDRYIEKEVSGSAEVTLSLSGTVESPSFQISLESEKLNIDEAAFANVDMQFEGVYYSNSCLDAQFSLNIDEPHDQIQLSSSVTWCLKDIINIKDLRIIHPKANIHGDLAYSITSHELDGSINGKINDLKVLENFMPYDFQGKVDFDASLSHDDTGGQSIEMSLYSDHASVDNVALDSLKGMVSISNAYEHPDGLIDFTLKQLSIDDAIFENIHLTSQINENQKAWPFELSFGGNTVIAKGEGYLEYTNTSLDITLDELAGSKAGHNFNLISPITLHLAEGSTQLSPFMLNVNNGFLQATLNIEDQSKVQSSLRMVGIPLSFLSSEIYSQPFDGVVTASVDIYGTDDQLFGNAQADFSELTFKNIDQLGTTPTNASLEAKLSSDGATFKGLLYGPGGTPIDIQASLPIKLMLRAPMIHVDNKEDIAITLKASGTITPIIELFAAEDFVFSGEGEIQVDVAGTLLSPNVTGKASVFNGSLESFVFGTHLKDIQATFEGGGSHVKITSFSAFDHKDGKLEGAGYFGLLAKEQYPFELNLNLAKLRLLRLDNTKATFDGKLSIKGNSEKIDIKGDIESQKIDHKIAKKIDEITETVAVTYINQDPSELSPTKIYRPQLTKVPTNVELHLKIPTGVLKVTDDDLSSSWGGDILLSGQLSKLKAKGEIKLDKGHYLLNGQMFDLTNGTITLAGDPEKKTAIYVVASRDINDYRVDVVIRGKLTNPSIILRSSPALPQQEILSLILFGEAPTEISYMQDQQLERSLSSLTKDQSGPGALSKLQKSIGIDRIDFNRQELDDHEEMSIQIGKYITKDIYISLNKGFGDEPTRVAVEAKIRKDLKVQIDAGESTRGGDAPTSGQISLLWKHDY